MSNASLNFYSLLLASSVRIWKRSLSSSWQRSSAPCSSLRKSAPIALLQISTQSDRAPVARLLTPADELDTDVCRFHVVPSPTEIGKCCALYFLMTHLIQVMLHSQHVIQFIRLALKGFVQKTIVSFKSFNRQSWSIDLAANWCHLSQRFLFVSLLRVNSWSICEMI